MNIVFFALDSLRADRAPPQNNSLAPNLASFSDEAFTFTNAVATGSWTVPSHTSMFTGQYPSLHGASATTKHFTGNTKTIAESLSNQDYSSSCIITNPWLTEQFGLTAGFDKIVDLRDSPPFPDTPDPRESISTTGLSPTLAKDLLIWVFSGNPATRLGKAIALKFFYEQTHPDASTVVDAVIDEMNSLSGDSFMFANFMDPHEPYFDSETRKKVRWNLHSVGKSHSISPDRIRTAYDESVRELDRELGRYFEYLRQEDLYDDSLIILVGDHGQALGEHGYWGHGTYLYDCLVDVPLFIKPPGEVDENEIDGMFSIRRLYNLILDFTTNGSEVTADVLADYTEDVVIAESDGPHMNCRYPEDEINESGYRLYKSSNWATLEFRTTDEIEILKNSTDKSTKTIRDNIQELKSEHELDTERASESIDIDGSTKRQLEELGYM